MSDESRGKIVRRWAPQPVRELSADVLPEQFVSDRDRLEGIVRALADQRAPILLGACSWCRVGQGYEYECVDLGDHETHAPDCPWRLAVEYVQDNNNHERK